MSDAAAPAPAPADRPDAADLVAIGKHAGRRFSDVVADDPPYAIWAAVESTDVDSAMYRFGEYARAHFESLGGNVPLFFGKNGHLTYEQVSKQDPNYCEYLVKCAEDGTKNANLKYFVHWFKTKGRALATGEP